MSIMKQEIRQCMSGLRKDEEGRVCARFSFPETFTGFKGHFPGRPILPGICTILAGIVIAEEVHRKRIELKKIIQAKFFNTVSQNEELLFECSEHKKKDEGALMKVLISSNSKKIAIYELRISFSREKF
jgi:3-hydroxyacyl-[acyl-carrier-protein] dehydratase